MQSNEHIVNTNLTSSKGGIKKLYSTFNYCIIYVLTIYLSTFQYHTTTSHYTHVHKLVYFTRESDTHTVILHIFSISFARLELTS